MNLGVRFLFFILSAVIICSQQTHSQQQGTPESEFTIGTFMYTDNPDYYQYFHETGMNYQVAGYHNQAVNSPVKRIGANDLDPQNFITKYSRGGYYSRWDAEREEFALLKTGVKHINDGTNNIYGHPQEYDNSMCWASDSNLQQTVQQPMIKFQFGPNYRQDKKYYWFQNHGQLIPYRLKYRMALTGGAGYSPETVVCTLRVLYTYEYTVNNIRVRESVQLGNSKILKVSDFSGIGLDIFQLTYNYQGYSFDTKDGSIPDSIDIGGILYEDDLPETGVEFIIDYNGIGKLYVDYVEVYDDLIWAIYIQDPNFVATEIKTYCNNTNSSNLAYWQAYEEPYTIDAYEPFRIVDSIVTEHTNKSIITVIYPNWRGQQNGDDHLESFVAQAEPKKLLIDWYPFWPNETAERGFDFTIPIFKLIHLF